MAPLAGAKTVWKFVVPNGQEDDADKGGKRWKYFDTTKDKELLNENWLNMLRISPRLIRVILL